MIFKRRLQDKLLLKADPDLSLLIGLERREEGKNHNSLTVSLGPGLGSVLPFRLCPCTSLCPGRLPGLPFGMCPTMIGETGLQLSFPLIYRITWSSLRLLDTFCLKDSQKTGNHPPIHSKGWEAGRLKVGLLGPWWAGLLGTRSDLTPKLLPTIQSQSRSRWEVAGQDFGPRPWHRPSARAAAGKAIVQAPSRGPLPTTATFPV